MTYFNASTAKSKKKNKTQHIWRNMNFTFKNKFFKLNEKWKKTYSVKVPLKILLNFQILYVKIIGYVNTKYIF